MTKEKRFALYICGLPLMLSLVLYQGLPANFPMQFNSQGEVNYYFPKLVALLLLNLITIYVNWLYFYRIKKNPSLAIANPFFLYLRLSAIPVIISLVIVGIWLTTNKEKSFSISDMLLVVIGILFIVVGNFLPKNKNKKMFFFPFIGNEPADNRVWRILGIGMVVSGVSFFLNIIFHSQWLMIIPFILCVILPLVFTIKYQRPTK